MKKTGRTPKLQYLSEILEKSRAGLLMLYSRMFNQFHPDKLQNA